MSGGGMKPVGGKDSYCSGSGGWSGGDKGSPCVSAGVFLRDCRVRGPHSVGLQHSGGRTLSRGLKLSS